MSRSRVHQLMLVLLLVCGAFSVPAATRATPAASAAVITTLSDAADPNDGLCTLREQLNAIGIGTTYNECPALSGPLVTLTFSSSGKITLVNGVLPYINKNVAITGPIIIEGKNDHIFVVASAGKLALTNLTLTKGKRAIRVDNGSLYVAGVAFNDNTFDNSGGAAIYATGPDASINIAGATFTNNTVPDSSGGAIYVGGIDSLKIAGTVFNGNHARLSGGALSTSAPTILTDVLFNGNVADGDDGDDDSADEGGGAIYIATNTSDTVPVTLTRTVFNGNLSPKGSGGAIFINSVENRVLIEDSSFNGNLAGTPPDTTRMGAAMYSRGTTSIEHVTFINNAVVGDGGALANDRKGLLTVSNSSIIANAATGKGAGVFTLNTQQGSSIRPNTTLLNTTLALNAALDAGGGIYTQEPTNPYPQVTVLGNTIISGSDGAGLGGNCAGTAPFEVTSLGHNLDSGSSCGLNGSGDLSNATANLQPPALNGGPIPTSLSMKLGAGSAAIDAGDATICADPPVNAEDQNNTSRPQDGSGNGTAACDMGAVENGAVMAGYGSTPVQPGPIVFGNAVVGTTINANFEMFNTGTGPLNISAATLSGPNAGDFARTTTLPLTLTPNATAAMQLACTPTAIGLRTATLTLTTNDPQHSSVAYTLLCNGTAQPQPGYGSTPAAPGPISFGSVIIGSTAHISLTVQETGNASLTVNNASLSGDHQADFSFGASVDLNLPDGQAPFNIDLTCTPAAPGIRTATLTLATNDPTKPTVSYTLSCSGESAPIPPLAVPGVSVGNSIGDGNNGPYGIATSPNGANVYVVDSGDDLLTAYSRKPDGSLQFIAAYINGYNDVETMDAPRSVAVSADGNNVYVTSTLGDSVIAFARNPDDGKLTFIDKVADGDSYGCLLFDPTICDGTVDGLDGAHGLALSADGRFVYVGGINDDALVVLRRSAGNGGLRSIGPKFGPNYVQTYTAPASELDAVYGLTLSPDGTNLYATAYNADRIVVFNRNAVDGRISLVQSLHDGQIVSINPPQFINGLDGALDVVVSPDGNAVYVTGWHDHALAVFQRDLADGGKLRYQRVYRDGVDALDGLANASHITVTPDGKHVLVTGYSDQALAVFERTAATGDLRQVQVVQRTPLVGANPDPALGGPRGVVVSPDGQTVYVAAYRDNRVVILPFARPTPVLDSVSPASATAGAAALTLTVSGANFQPDSLVRWNGADRPTTFVNAGLLKASIAATDLASAGSATVGVWTPAPGGGGSNVLPFTISAPNQNPVPSISDVLPAGAAAGGPAQVMTVKGANFLPTSVVRWNGAVRSTTFVSGSTLQATIAVDDIAQPGTVGVTVANPAPGGGISNAVPFEVVAPGNNPLPAISSVDPPSVNVANLDGAGLVLTLEGSNFIPDSVVRWNGADRPTDYVSSTHVKVAVNAADVLVAGTASLSVFNPAPGGGESNVATFTIAAAGDNPVPVITAYSIAQTGGTLLVTLTGSGFGASSQVRWNGAAHTTTLLNPTHVRFSLTPTEFGRRAVITVINPAPGGGVSNEVVYVPYTLYLPLVKR